MSTKNDNNDHQFQNGKQDDSGDEQLDRFIKAFIKKTSDFYQRYFKNVTGKSVFSILGLLLISAWLLSGVYIVDQGNRGVVTQFEAYKETTFPGPHWHIPYPIEAVKVVNIEQQRFIELGYRTGGTQSSAVLPEALMLTKDENIVSVRLAVQYQISNAKDYLFNVKGNQDTLKQITESIERGVIGKNSMDFILTEGRSQVVSEIKDGIQTAMDQYSTGLRVTSVNLQDAQPPEDVQSAFEDAIRAREDKQRLINEAQAYANEVVPKARGAASRIIQEAEAYEAKIVAKASGEAERFGLLLTEYEKAPKVTRKRLYLEAKEKLYSHTNKVVVNVENGNNMLYLPLNQITQQNNPNNNQQIQYKSQQQVNSPRRSDAVKPKSSRIVSNIRPSRS